MDECLKEWMNELTISWWDGLMNGWTIIPVV
jgi:hypothetical protein